MIESFGKVYKYLLTVFFELLVIVLKKQILNCQLSAENYKSVWSTVTGRYKINIVYLQTH